MKSWILAASLLLAVPTGHALAADLGDDGPDRYGQAYEDPRYADMYRYPDARPPIPREPVYRDDDDYVPPRYSYSGPRAPYRGNCVPRAIVKHRLHEQGWHDFQDIDLRGEVATVIARRPSGRKFELTVDRCSGEIINAQRIESRQYGPYAYGGPGPRRWERY